MAGKPAEPLPSGEAQAGQHNARDETAPTSERDGPLAIERLRKDDGRALILYSSVERAARE